MIPTYFLSWRSQSYKCQFCSTLCRAALNFPRCSGFVSSCLIRSSRNHLEVSQTTWIIAIQKIYIQNDLPWPVLSCERGVLAILCCRDPGVPTGPSLAPTAAASLRPRVARGGRDLDEVLFGSPNHCPECKIFLKLRGVGFFGVWRPCFRCRQLRSYIISENWEGSGQVFQARGD